MWRKSGGKVAEKWRKSGGKVADYSRFASCLWRENGDYKICSVTRCFESRLRVGRLFARVRRTRAKSQPLGFLVSSHQIAAWKGLNLALPMRAIFKPLRHALSWYVDHLSSGNIFARAATDTGSNRAASLSSADTLTLPSWISILACSTSGFASAVMLVPWVAYAASSKGIGDRWTDAAQVAKSWRGSGSLCDRRNAASRSRRLVNAVSVSASGKLSDKKSIGAPGPAI